MIIDETIWGVTVELNLKYKKPIPLNKKLRVIARITKDSSRLFEGTGEIILGNGEIAVSALGKYLKMPIEKIADFNKEGQEWQVILSDDEPKEIDI